MAPQENTEARQSGPKETVGQARVLVVADDSWGTPRVAERLLRGAVAECRVEAVSELSEAMRRLDDEPAVVVLVGRVASPQPPTAALDQLRSVAPESLILPLDQPIQPQEGEGHWLGHALRHLARQRTYALASLASGPAPIIRDELDAVGDAVITTDRTGHITYSNTSACALTGWAIDDAIGLSLGNVFDIRHALAGHAADNPADKAMNRGCVIDLSAENTLQRRDGTALPIHYSAAPIVDADGHTAGAIVVFRRLPAHWPSGGACDQTAPSAPPRTDDDEATSPASPMAAPPSEAIASARVTEQLINGDRGAGRDKRHHLLLYQPECTPDEGHVQSLCLISHRTAASGMRKPGQSLEHLAVGGACRQLGAWRRAGIGTPRVSVEASAAGLSQLNFASDLAETLRQAGLGPGQLELTFQREIIEIGGEAVRRTLGTLRELGIALAVNDFGTGYGGIKGLHRIPVDTLKLDAQLLRPIATSPRARTLAGTMIDLAKRLGYPVVAQGVDTESQLAFAREHGCEGVSGQRLGRALNADDAGLLVAMSRTADERSRA